jgi:hypothetical protein
MQLTLPPLLLLLLLLLLLVVVAEAAWKSRKQERQQALRLHSTTTHQTGCSLATAALASPQRPQRCGLRPCRSCSGFPPPEPPWSVVSPQGAPAFG